jgi:hypothetical protein
MNFDSGGSAVTVAVAVIVAVVVAEPMKQQTVRQ